MPTRKRKTFEYHVCYQDDNTHGEVFVTATSYKLAAFHVARSFGYQCRQTLQHTVYDYIYDLEKPHPPLKHGLYLQVVNCQTDGVKLFYVTN